MTQWKAIFSKKRRAQDDEGYACTGCGAKHYEPGCHTSGPPQGLCSCGMDHSKMISNAFRDGFDQIDWPKGKSPGQWVDIGRGVKRFVLKEDMPKEIRP